MNVVICMVDEANEQMGFEAVDGYSLQLPTFGLNPLGSDSTHQP